MNFRFKWKQLHSLAFSLLADILDKQIFCNLVLIYVLKSKRNSVQSIDMCTAAKTGLKRWYPWIITSPVIIYVTNKPLINVRE